MSNVTFCWCTRMDITTCNMQTQVHAHRRTHTHKLERISISSGERVWSCWGIVGGSSRPFLSSHVLTETSMTSCNPPWLNLLCVQTCRFANKLSHHTRCVCVWERGSRSVLMLCVAHEEGAAGVCVWVRERERCHRSHPLSRCCILLARLCVCVYILHNHIQSILCAALSMFNHRLHIKIQTSHCWLKLKWRMTSVTALQEAWCWRGFLPYCWFELVFVVFL